MARVRTPTQTIAKFRTKIGISKAQIQKLEDHFVMIGNKKFKAPITVKRNKIALEKWKEIMELYKNCEQVDIVTSADIGLLERYSLLYADMRILIEAKQEAYEKAGKSALEASRICNEHRLDNKIHARSKLLLKMENELFLTPLSKSRAIPRRKQKDKNDELVKKGFKLG